jgi:CBS domain-containing protein
VTVDAPGPPTEYSGTGAVADDSIEEAIRTMGEHQVRRLPVIDGHDLVGILTRADIARNYPEDRVGELAELVSFY